MYWDESWWGRQAFGAAFSFMADIIGRIIQLLNTPIDFGGNMNIPILHFMIAFAIFGLVISVVRKLYD